MEPTITVTLTVREARAIIAFVTLQSDQFITASTERLAIRAVEHLQERIDDK